MFNRRPCGLFNKSLFEKESRAILRVKRESGVFEGERMDRFLCWKSAERLEDLWGKVMFHPFCGWLCSGSVTSILCDCGQVCGGEIVGMTHIGDEKERGLASSDLVIQYNCV